MTTFIKKETISRLLKDVKYIIKNPLTENGIYYIHDDADIMKGYALIIGPSETPYFGGYYFFELNYPTDYPHSPPKVTYCTNGDNIRFNPNLYTCGKVCVSLLNTWRGDQWTSCQSINTVLLTLCSLLSSDPLLNEPGVSEKHADMKPYNEIIFYSNINIAVCDIVQKKPDVFFPFFENFYPNIKDNFLKNYDNLLEFSENKLKSFKGVSKEFRTGFYSMRINVDYSNLIEKIKQTKQIMEIM